jgi:hypothetical protein
MVVQKKIGERKGEAEEGQIGNDNEKYNQQQDNEKKKKKKKKKS